MPTHDDRDPGRAVPAGLHRLGQARRPGELEVPALVGEAAPVRRRPQPGDDLQLLGQPVEPLAERGAERQSVRVVLVGEPARAETQFDAAAGDVVDVGGGDRQHRRMPEGRRGDQRAEPDVGDLRRQRGQRRDAVRRSWQPVSGTHLQYVVGAEERREAMLAGRRGGGQQVGVRRSLLGLGEDAQVHASKPRRGPGGPCGPIRLAVLVTAVHPMAATSLRVGRAGCRARCHARAWQPKRARLSLIERGRVTRRSRRRASACPGRHRPSRPSRGGTRAFCSARHRSTDPHHRKTRRRSGRRRPDGRRLRVVRTGRLHLYPGHLGRPHQSGGRKLGGADLGGVIDRRRRIIGVGRVLCARRRRPQDRHLGRRLRRHGGPGRGGQCRGRVERHRPAAGLGELRRDHRALPEHVPRDHHRPATAELVLGAGDHRRRRDQGHRQGTRRLRPRPVGRATRTSTCSPRTRWPPGTRSPTT